MWNNVFGFVQDFSERGLQLGLPVAQSADAPFVAIVGIARRTRESRATSVGSAWRNAIAFACSEPEAVGSKTAPKAMQSISTGRWGWAYPGGLAVSRAQIFVATFSHEVAGSAARSGCTP